MEPSDRRAILFVFSALPARHLAVGDKKDRRAAGGDFDGEFLALAEWAAYNKPSSGFYLLPTRGWELLIGAIIAIVLTFEKRLRNPIAKNEAGVCRALGLLLIGYAIFAFEQIHCRSQVFMHSSRLSGTGLIICFATPDTFVGKLLGSRILVGVGLISYSAYLWHYPMFAFARHLGLDDSHKGIFLALGAAALMLAFVSWKYVERPFRRKKRESLVS